MAEKQLENTTMNIDLWAYEMMMNSEHPVS